MDKSAATLPALDLIDSAAKSKEPSQVQASGRKLDETVLEQDIAEQVYRLILNSGFGLHRQRLIEIFRELGGGACSRPQQIKPVLALCLSVSALSHLKGRSPLKIWFNYLSGRIELDCSNGRSDSLQVWSNAKELYCS